jgi:hypothetical protein
MGLPTFMIEKRRKQLAEQQKAKQLSLIQSLDLNKGVDPDIASAVARTIMPVKQPARKRPPSIRKAAETKAFEKAYKARTSEIQTFVESQPVLKEAVAAGSDPRTIQAIRKELIDTYTEGDIKASRIQGGKSQYRDIIRRRIREVERPQEVAKVAEKLKADIAVQPELEQIRQRRRRAVEQQASLLRRTTGRRALLASPTGGAGFFGGYFKG